jgi:hypothetical protein
MEMPQPLSKIVKNPPNQGIPIEMQPGNAAKQPELAALVAQAIGIWSLVDCTIGQIFVDILGAKAAPAVAMFDALSPAARMTAFEAAARFELDAEKRRMLEALMRIYRPAAQQRHKFAHWIWAYCELAPDYLVLLEPARIVHEHTVIAQLKHKQITDLTETKFTIPWSDEWDAYSKEELLRIVNEFSDVLNLFRWYQSLVRKPPTLEQQALAYLNSNAKIVVELAHLAKHQGDA